MGFKCTRVTSGEHLKVGQIFRGDEVEIEFEYLNKTLLKKFKVIRCLQKKTTVRLWLQQLNTKQMTTLSFYKNLNCAGYKNVKLKTHFYFEDIIGG